MANPLKSSHPPANTSSSRTFQLRTICQLNSPMLWTATFEAAIQNFFNSAFSNWRLLLRCVNNQTCWPCWWTPTTSPTINHCTQSRQQHEILQLAKSVTNLSKLCKCHGLHFGNDEGLVHRWNAHPWPRAVYNVSRTCGKRKSPCAACLYDRWIPPKCQHYAVSSKPVQNQQNQNSKYVNHKGSGKLSGYLDISTPIWTQDNKK